MSARPHVFGLLILLACVVGASPADAEPLRLEDMGGRTVTLAEPAARIVALPLPSGPTLVAASRSADRLVAVHPTARDIMLAGPLGRLFVNLAATDGAVLQSGGAAFMPNVEALAVLDPDLVVQRGELGPAIVEPLEQAGLTTLLVTYGTEEMARRNIALLSAAVGETARGEELLAWREETRHAIAASLGAGPASGAAPGVLFLSRAAGGFSTTGGGTPNDHAIAVAGGRNLAGELPGSAQVGTEQILLWDPEVIVLNSGDPKLTPASLAADPVLSALSAVRMGRVYKAPTGGYRLEPPGPENPLYWLWMATVLHPDQAGADLRETFAAGFARVYGARPTPDELDAMLQLRANAASADAARLGAAR